MKTAEEVIVEVETKHDVRFYGKEKQMITEALHSYAESIREECARVARETEAKYPTDVFPEPYPQCAYDLYSAAGARLAARNIAEDIEAMETP